MAAGKGGALSRALVVLLGVSALTLVLVSVPTPAQAATSTSVEFSAHEDDDLLFMNPDIVSNVQAGRNVWIVYMTAGDVPYRPGQNYGGAAYADMRIQGERAAWARGAHAANNWVFELMTFAGHSLATNRLVGTNLRLIFTFIHAAAGPEDPCGDLYRMWHSPSFVAQPIDGRASYTKDSFTAMLRAILAAAVPTRIRTQSTLGYKQGDHVDHTSSGVFAADADADSSGRTVYRRDEYLGYIIANYPDNVSAYWRTEKTDMWNQYWPHDPALGPGAWQNVMGKQYHPGGQRYLPGAPWADPRDFTSC